jgi:hypothetical protein
VKLIYVAGPFSAPTRQGVEDNIARAVAVGIEVARAGGFPVVPHANTSHPDYECVQPYKFWIAGTLELLRRCDALITVDGWRNSSGATKEHDHMVGSSRPVFYNVEALRGWLARESSR